ncbi:MAG: hypothetical protein N4A61_08045 [Pelagimonas sp.]|jgi:hypothetical protein|nr:hypothetical protein [Pelagimonas sp.]
MARIVLPKKKRFFLFGLIKGKWAIFRLIIGGLWLLGVEGARGDV